jgi:hypothetical protein
MIGSSGGPPTMRRAPAEAVDFREASGMVGSAREAAHRQGGKLGRRLGLGQDFMKSRIANAYL